MTLLVSLRADAIVEHGAFILDYTESSRRECLAQTWVNADRDHLLEQLRPSFTPVATPEYIVTVL